METTIRDDQGHTLRAKVEVLKNAIIVHSRSGGGAAARNPEYRPALEAILDRLGAVGEKPDVYLDSRPVEHLPLSGRKLISGAALAGTREEQFLTLLKAMNAGSASNGAYRRLRLEVPSLTGHQLVRVIGSKERSSRF